MTRWRVTEVQHITYEWDVEVEGDGGHDGYDLAVDGVPDDAQVVRFESWNHAEEVPS